MAGLPPPPINDAPGSFTWLEWYRQLRNYVSTSGSVPWYILNFAGSNITDIAQRSHNQLQTLQGGASGEMYHLSADAYASVANNAEGTWTPTFTSLTEVLGGGSITKTGTYTRVGNVVFYTILIETTGGATTASTAGTTYCDLPITPVNKDVCSVGRGTNIGIGVGVVNTNCYPTTWGATSDTIIISGKFEV